MLILVMMVPALSPVKYFSNLGDNMFMNVILVLILLFQSSLALASDHRKDARYVEDGIVYEFKNVPNYDSKGELMYYTGEISISTVEGETILMSRTNHSPGCASDFPAINTLNVPVLPKFPSEKGKKRTFIAFCGSNSGRHSTLRLYDPHFGFVEAIDFFNGPVRIRESESALYFVVNYREFVDLSHQVGYLALMHFYYPVVYELTTSVWSALNVSVSISNSERSKEIYWELLEDSKDFYSEDLSDLDRLANSARILAISILSGDKENYCRESMKFTNKPLQYIQEILINQHGRDFTFTFNCQEK